MTKEPLVPRPGVKPTHNFSFRLSEKRDLDEKEKAELQSKLNERWTSGERGTVQINFRSNIRQGEPGRITILTTASTINDTVLESLQRIVEQHLDVNVVAWTDDVRLERKSLTGGV